MFPGGSRREGPEDVGAPATDLLRHAFDHAPIGMAVLDPAGRFLRLNAALCDMLGYAGEELVARTLEDVTHPDDRGEATAAASSGERRFTCGDGHVIWARLTVSSVGNAGAGARWRVAQLEDVTERRAAEERLRRSEARFRALIERSQDLIVLVDQGGHNVFTSPSVVDILGFTPEEQREIDFRELVHPDDAPVAQGAFEAMFRDPATPVRATLRLRRKDGTYRALDSVSRNLFADPAVRAIVVNARDVTDQLRLLEQLTEAQKLDSVGRLAGGVAHDFNNLLCVILSCAELLGEELPEGTGAREEVGDIRRAAERARDLTGQLLAVGRRQVISPRLVDANAVVHDAEGLVRRLVGEDLRVVVRLAPALPRVLVDPTQLQQVILNLAANARDATPNGGTLTVATSVAEVDARDAELHGGAPGSHVVLAVTDTGAGMSAEARAHLFEPFFTTKPPGKGTGLGLATVYGIVRQAGGHVRVESRAGEGTTVACWLPRAVVPAADAAPTRPPRPAPRGAGTVLVVEDDPVVRGLAARALESAGYRVHAADGAAAAIAAAGRAGTIDLLLTDVVMPGTNGREIADALRRSSPHLHVLFMSGYTHDVIAKHGVLDSGVQFLAKPFTPSSLVAKVRAVLDLP